MLLESYLIAWLWSAAFCSALPAIVVLLHVINYLFSFSHQTR